MKLGMVDYVRDPTSHDIFGGGAQGGGLGKYVTCHISEFLFFCFSLACAQVAFLDPTFRHPNPQNSPK